MMFIKIQNSNDGQFYFTVVSSNGQVLATSGTYTDKDKCKQTAKCLNGQVFEIGDFTTRRKPVKKGLEDI